jgi:cytochrome c oxidase subunit 2
VSLAVNVGPLDCAGPNACDIVSIYTSIFWIAMAVLVIVGGLLVYAALRFRRKDDREPLQVHGNPRLEILWTAIPVLIVSFLFIRTTLRMDYVRNGPPPQQTIQVTGIQWAWSFKYPNGRTSNTKLTIPAGQVIRLQVTSKDVLHSFWVPRLGRSTRGPAFRTAAGSRPVSRASTSANATSSAVPATGSCCSRWTPCRTRITRPF